MLRSQRHLYQTRREGRAPRGIDRCILDKTKRGGLEREREIRRRARPDLVMNAARVLVQDVVDKRNAQLRQDEGESRGNSRFLVASERTRRNQRQFSNLTRVIQCLPQEV